MGAAALPAITAIGTIGGLVQGSKANKAARAQLGLQTSEAQRQSSLFQQASPIYGQILQALAGTAGLGPTPAGYPGAAQLPYTNITSGQLGPYANPTDALRLRAAEDYSRQGLNSALHNLNFGLGQRGLTGSSIHGAQEAALIGQALQGRNDFARQLAIQAPETYQTRLGNLAGLLNVGLGAGPIAANIFGQGAQSALGQAGQFGQQVSGTLGAFMQQQQFSKMLQQLMRQQQPTIATPPIAPTGGGVGGWTNHW